MSQSTHTETHMCIYVFGGSWGREEVSGVGLVNRGPFLCQFAPEESSQRTRGHQVMKTWLQGAGNGAFNLTLNRCA